MNIPKDMLSGPHKVFSEKIAEGMNQTRAYMAAYPEAGYDTARNRGAQLIAQDCIRTEVERLRIKVEEALDGVILNMSEKRRILSTIAKEGERDSDRINAIKVDTEHASLSQIHLDSMEALNPEQMKATVLRLAAERAASGSMSNSELTSLVKALTQEEKSQAQIYKLQTDAAEAVAELMADVEKAKGLRALAEDKTVPHSQYLEAVRQRMFGGNAIPAPGNAA